LAHRLAPPAASTAVKLCSLDELSNALKGGGLLVDLRAADCSEADSSGCFAIVAGSLSQPWDRAKGTMSTDLLPREMEAPIILHCSSGSRARLAKTFLEKRGHLCVLNAGGPKATSEAAQALWSTLSTRGASRHTVGFTKFVQLFDGPAPEGTGSSTYTYILGDAESGEGIVIDPVAEHVNRDLASARQLGVKLTMAVNTHCHADHLTGTRALKERVPGLRSAISKASGAKADVYLHPGETVEWAAGARSLTMLSTPGHTNGCFSFYDKAMGAVFTGDALLIAGCGRTDFQEGSAEVLYTSVHSQIFTLPAETIVYPAHDYKGRLRSSVGHEKATNPRLTKSKGEYVELMRNLNLSYPKKIDLALPFNLRCGAPQ